MVFLKDNITIVGGDLRIVELSRMFANEGNIVYTYGLEKVEDIDNIKKCETLDGAIKSSEITITSIPLSSDKTNINLPFSEESISVERLLNSISDNLILTGNIKGDIKLLFEKEKINYIDLLEREELAILNCISTAEGAIQIAMQETKITLHGSNILILGFGRIGKIVAKMLIGIGVNVYCEARKYEDLAYIEAFGYIPVDLLELDSYLSDFQVIINTIPAMVIGKEQIDLLKKDCLIIDLASSPGGVDFEYAKQKQIKTIWALALPGKVAPITSAKYIKQTINNVFKEIKI